MNHRRPDFEHGEGNYVVTRRHRRPLEKFTETHDLERAARDAAPESGAVAEELKRAERAGPARSHGEDTDSGTDTKEK